MAVYDTATLINVSQGAKSSPLADGPAPVGESVEVVEDSFPANDTATRDPVAEQTRVAGDDEDELYAISPRGRASLDALRSVAKANTKMALDIEVAKQVGYRKSEQRPDFLNDARMSAAPPNSLGFTDRVSSDKLQGGDDGLTAPVGANPRQSSGKKPSFAKSTGHGKEATRSREMRLQSAIPASGSTLEALRAKRDAKLGGTQNQKNQQLGPPMTQPDKQKGTAMSVGNERQALKERDNNHRTPRHDAPKEQHTQQRLSTVKPSSRRRAMLSQTSKIQPTESASEHRKPRRSQTPSAPPATEARRQREREHSSKPADRSATTGSEQVKQKRKAVKSPDQDGSNEAGNNKRAGQREDKATKLTGSLNRAAAKGALPSEIARQALYDLPNSPSATEDARRGKGRPPLGEKPSQSAVISTKLSVDDAHHVRLTTKVGATSKVTPSGTMPETDQVVDSEIAPGTFGRSKKESKLLEQHDGVDVSDAARRETVQDFEQAVISYGDDDENAQEIGTLQEPSKLNALPPLHRASDAAPDVPIKVESMERRPRPMSGNESAPAGNSQKEPIVLSDRNPSSSPTPSPVNPAPKAGETKPLINDVARPTKRPQTPAVVRSSPPISRSGGTALNTTRKSTIIGFDKSGPRNQGSLSGRTPVVPGSVWTSRTSVPPSRASLALEAGGSRAKLEARRKQGPSSGAPSMRSTRSQRAAPPPNVAPTAGDALAGFFKKFRKDASTPEIERWSKPISSAKGETTAQTACRQTDDDEFVEIDDYEGPTLVGNAPDDDLRPVKTMEEEQPTASQVAMPPPASKPAKQQTAVQAPAVLTMLASGGEGRTEKSSTKPADNKVSKRKAATAHEEGPPAKAAKPITRPSMTQNLSTTAANVAAETSQRKWQTQQISMHNSIQRTTRTVSRHASQGSQTVDLGGSPVPRGLFVTDQDTALEVFVEQTEQSSDNVVEEAASKDEKTTLLVDADLAASRAHFAPPSRKPEILPSNVKPLPASPRAESQAITGVALRRVDPRTLSTRDDDAPSSEDPFTSSEDVRKRPLKGSTSSVFFDQLHRQIEKSSQARDTNEKSHKRDNVPPAKARRISITSHGGSSDSSSEAESGPSRMQGLSIWRQALQPHQANLFDELVNVSHRLVSHLVSQEEASRNVVVDYGRRGLRLVEEMEQSHAQQYQEQLHDLKRRKKRMRKDLEKCSRHLDSARATVERSREEGKANAGDCDTRELRKLMAEYC